MLQTQQAISMDLSKWHNLGTSNIHFFSFCCRHSTFFLFEENCLISSLVDLILLCLYRSRDI
uniref:Uncharacterized protein n=1 Tax=Rhizophora mucronata TaxID=61149 RepID=A0A2P2LX14_RHIMU